MRSDQIRGTQRNCSKLSLEGGGNGYMKVSNMAVLAMTEILDKFKHVQNVGYMLIMSNATYNYHSEMCIWHV